jgi:hypothetical protein
MSTPTSGRSYLRTLPSIRERCSKVYELAQHDKLTFFSLHEDKLQEVVEYCGKIITVSQLCLNSV